MKLFTTTIVLVLLSISKFFAQTIVYVDHTAAGLNNGLSWTNAYTELSAAILASNSGDEIWVADGTYYTTNDNDRTKSFVVNKPLSIYGGFNGSETLLTQRNPSLNNTILSGDIGVLSDSLDNSHQIFKILNQIGLVEINGFTIDHVYSLTNLGGAVHIDQSSNVKIARCTFNNNFADIGGGAAIHVKKHSKVKIEACSFIGNKCRMDGGAIYAKDTSIVEIEGALFLNNYSPANGSSIMSTISMFKLSNTTFTNSPLSKVFIYAYTSNYYDTTYYFKNCTFSGITTSSDLMTFNNVKTVVFDHCVFDGNTFTNSIPSAVNYYGTGISFQKCFFTNNSFFGNFLNLSGANLKLALLDSMTISGNTSKSQSIINFYGKNLILKNSILTDNHGPGTYQFYFNTIDTAQILNNRITSNTGTSQSAFSVSGKMVTFKNNSVENNSSGGSSVNWSPVDKLLCENSSFINNTGGYTGMINFYSTQNKESSFLNCVFKNNSSANYGGAIFVGGNARTVFKNNLFENNQAPKGGAIYSSSPHRIELHLTKFDNNKASEGGAIYASDSVFIERCYLVNNKTIAPAHYGSTLNTGKYSQLINTKMYHNSCDSNSVIFNKGQLDIFNCTIAENPSGGAVTNKFISNPLKNNFTNTIFWNNGELNQGSDTFNIRDLSATVRIMEHCISNEPRGGTNIVANPLLDFELRLSPLSPAIDAGMNYPNMPLIDYDSTNRIKLVAVDIGAYEISTDGRIQNIVMGHTYIDVDGNCMLDTAAGDLLLPGIPITVVPINQFTASDAKGLYIARLNPGNYSITAPTKPALTENYALSCPTNGKYDVSFSGYSDTLKALDFGYRKVVVQNCKADLALSVSYSTHRPCMYGQINVTAFNNREVEVSNVYIKALFPKDVFIKNSTYPYTRTGDTVIFSLGSMSAMSQKQLTIGDSINCSMQLIFTGNGCFRFEIKDNIDCVPPMWDLSNLTIFPGPTSGCNFNPLSTFITFGNYGQGDMADSTEYRIFDNYVLVKKGKVKLKRNENANIIYMYDVNKQNNPVVIEIDESPFHPTELFEQATIYPCLPSLSFISPSPFNQFRLITARRTSFRLKEDCIPFTGSYDPNNIEVTPNGLPPESYVRPNLIMNYQINFQNTGTDTAFAVVLVDTLDTNLQLNSLVLGASSHPYTWTLSGVEKPVLKIRFDNINLPDSNQSVSKSKGYVTYSIQQNSELPDDTKINATAGIYFDYNEPVHTNNAYVTIQRDYSEDLSLGDVFSLVYLNNTTTVFAAHTDNFLVSVYPNPILQEGHVYLDQVPEGKKKIAFYNPNGQLIKEYSFEGNTFSFQTKGLVSGLYYYKLYHQEQIIKIGKCIIGQ